MLVIVSRINDDLYTDSLKQRNIVCFGPLFNVSVFLTSLSVAKYEMKISLLVNITKKYDTISIMFAGSYISNKISNKHLILIRLNIFKPSR